MYSITANGLTYPVNQINGQRISGPPAELMFFEPASYERNEIFVTNLPRKLYEDFWLPLFSTCGVVYKLRLMMCFSGNNRGFLYVLFVNEEDANFARSLFSGFPVHDRLIYAHRSSNKRNLVMGNINFSLMSLEQIEHEVFELTNCRRFLRCFNDKGKFMFIVIEYKSHYDAAMARRALTSQLNYFGEKCYVKWQSKH